MATKKSSLSKINPVNITLPSDEAALRDFATSLLISYQKLYQKKEADDAAHRLVVKGLKSQISNLKADSLTDELTGLPNRRFVNTVFATYHAQARRDARSKDNVHQQYLMLDLDGFKKVNDTFGHDVGDQILKELGDRLASMFDEKNPDARFLRPRDGLARWGGEEFLITLDGSAEETDIKKRYAKYIADAEHIRKAVESKPFTVKLESGEQLQIWRTISIGMNVYSPPRGRKDHDTTFFQAVKGADKAVYKAKGKMKVGHETVDDPKETDTRNRICYMNQNGELIKVSRAHFIPPPSEPSAPSFGGYVPPAVGAGGPGG